MRKPLTLDLLKENGACLAQRRLFRKLFGDGGTVTLARIKKADKADLRISWAVINLLTYEQREAYYSDEWVQYCREKYMAAPCFSRREDYWRGKQYEAKLEAFVRVWNDPVYA